MNLPKRSAEELAAALRARADLLGGDRFEAPATAAMMHEAADMIDELVSAALALELPDLANLVANLASEHFPYNERGAAALRAYRVLAEAVETDAAAITIHQHAKDGNK